MTTLTTEEIVKMAIQAGYRELPTVRLAFQGFDKVAFAKLVAAKAAEREREACAKFFDDNDMVLFWGSQAAENIRARGVEAT